MHIASVLVGQRRELEFRNNRTTTGIFKEDVEVAEIRPQGLTGDHIINTGHHGGLDQAVYIYGSIDYAWWGREGYPEKHGTFGENLVIDGFACTDCGIGDRLSIGASVELEITAPRIPCATLGARMGDNGFTRRFREARRPGCYCRVIRPGVVRSGDPVDIEAYSGERLGVLELFDLAYVRSPTIDDLQRVLAAPIASRERAHREQQLNTSRGA